MRPYNWVNIVWHSILHFLGIVGIIHQWYYFSLWTLLLGIAMFIASGFSITAGYHRCFAHRSFKCGKVIEFLFLFFGAGAWQNSVDKWAYDHRNHHHFPDTAKDPYSMDVSFWHAHILWMFRRIKLAFDPESPLVRDLRANGLVRMQSLLYLPLAITAGLLLPACIALLWKDFWGGLLFGGFTRILLQSHSTMSVNSFAHWIGSKPYSLWTSAVDNIVVALFTLGEGWHNRHHRFPGDYRCGVLWWKLDTTKWAINFLALFGLAWDLVRVPEKMAKQIKT